MAPPISEFEIYKAKNRRQQIDIDISITPQSLALTPQEEKVFTLIAEGIDRDHSQNYIKEIAKEMCITPQCVNQYLRKIRMKLRGYLQHDKKIGR